MSAFILLTAAASGGQIEKVARTFGVDWQHLTVQIISFGIVCALLSRFAYRPILKMLEERKNQIAQGLANSEKIKAELDRTEVLRHEVLTKANVQATSLIEEARAAAARLEAEQTKKAMITAEQIVAQSREQAVQDQARMLAELKAELGQLVVQTTAIVIGKALTAEDQKRLTEEAAKQMMSSGKVSAIQ
jgi:F-type H+-transporting ATPase subunit b